MSAAAFVVFRSRFEICGKTSSAAMYYNTLANDIINAYNTAYA
jgi:hypothetical protein